MAPGVEVSVLENRKLTVNATTVSGRPPSRARAARYAVLLLFVFLLMVPPMNHALGQTLPPGGLGVDAFGTEDGLPGLSVTDMAMTGDGLLWVISSGRLTAFDGLRFEEHELEVTSNLAEGRLTAVGTGRGDTLWVTVGDRLVSYVRGRTTIHAQHEHILRDVWQREDGVVWVLDDRGVMHHTASGFVREVDLVFAHARPEFDRAVDSVTLRADEWLHDTGRGALARVFERWVLDPLPFPTSWPAGASAGTVFVSRPGAATLEVTRLDGEHVAVLPANPGRTPLFLDRRGLLWATAAGRVDAFDRSGERLAGFPLPPGARVRAFVEDGEGNGWLGTVRNGLFRIRPRPIRVLGAAEGVTDGQVLRVSAGSDGAVLMLDNETGVTSVRGNAVDTVFERSPEIGGVTAALVDHRGTTWLARLAPVEMWLEGRTPRGRDIRVPFSGFPPQHIVDDPDDGRLWLAGARVRALRPYADDPTLETYPMPRGWVTRDILVDRDGSVWLAAAVGLVRISDDGMEEFLAVDGFPTGDARALYLDADGTLWIGRYYGGIVRYRDGQFKVVRAADGLWDDVVSALLEDDRGNFWMNGNRGIHRVGRSELNDFLDGRSARVRGVGYGVAAGLRNPEGSGWPGYRSPDGQLWFPTFSGVAVVDPATVREYEQTPPRVRILGIDVGGARRARDSTVNLVAGQRRFDVAYAATLLSGQRGLRYRVFLEGVDPDWVDVGGQTQVTYGNVPPGRRSFRVRAVSGPGVASANEASVNLVVPSFFHETWKFYALLAAIAGTGIVGVHRLRIRQLQAREVRLRRLVDERTHDLARSQERTEEALATVEAQATELKSLDEAKSRFFANVSHELRTPLTLVQGPLQDVLDGRLGEAPEPVKEQVEIVLASGRRLGDLVEQLLDVARLESGEFRMNVRQEDLRPLLERLVASFEALARNRRIRFETTLPEGDVPATVDADRIEKVYGNLLANAFKFTPEGGRVRFRVELSADGDAGELVATVEDDGPGIPPDERDKIFQRFHQVDGSTRRAHGGAGLGLALVKEITELHGGSVEVWSEPGTGSRFTVRIPTDGGASDGAITPAISFPVSESDARPSPVSVATASVPDTIQLPAPDDADRPTILVVEDHDELRAYLRRHLETDYRLVEARDGREGLDAARRVVPDLILCDIMMPGMDGEELCRAIRKDAELDFLPVVMVTAKASRHSRLSALEGGADDYIVKPFDPEELRLRVGNLLAARRRLQDRLREEGKALPFAALERPAALADASFAEKIEATLREHMGDEDFDVTAMAKTLNVSRATLYRKIEEMLATSPMELLWRFRLTQAAHWLKETDATVSEIAYAAGFKTVPHFARRFKEHFETTPAAYRVA